MDDGLTVPESITVSSQINTGGAAQRDAVLISDPEMTSRFNDECLKPLEYQLGVQFIAASVEYRRILHIPFRAVVIARGGLRGPFGK